MLLVAPAAAQAPDRIATTADALVANPLFFDGKRVVSHWSECQHLAQRYPEARVEVDPIFVRDGALLTSAGVTPTSSAISRIASGLNHPSWSCARCASGRIADFGSG